MRNDELQAIRVRVGRRECWREDILALLAEVEADRRSGACVLAETSVTLHLNASRSLLGADDADRIWRVKGAPAR